MPLPAYMPPQVLQPEAVTPPALVGGGAPSAVKRAFSYTSLLPYPPQTLASMTASRMRRMAASDLERGVNTTRDNIIRDENEGGSTGSPLTTEHNAPQTNLCLLNVGKSGSGAVLEGLAQGLTTTTNMVVLHEALREPVFLRQRTPRAGLRVHRFDGPLAEGLPSFSPCLNTGQVVTWVRDPVARFLATWHAAICHRSECDEPRKRLWQAALGQKLVTSSTSATTLDLNMLIDELARRDGGELPGQATFAFIRAIDDGITGLAAYLPDCSVHFLRRHPLRFVGRAEHMEKDWLALFSQANATAGNATAGATPQIGQEHLFDDPHPRRTLSRDSINWLRTFYRDDYVCMKNLGEAELVPKDYVEEVSSSRAEYMYWGAMSKQCNDLWKSGGLDKLAGVVAEQPASSAGDARCSIEPWPRPLDRGKGAWEVNNLKLAKSFALESWEPLNETFLPFNGGQSWTAKREVAARG